MALDTRIPLMAAQPRNSLTDSYVQAMQLKNMQQQMQAQEAAQQRESQRANLLRQYGGDLEGAAGAAFSAGDLETGLKLEQVVSGRKKSERDERRAAIKDRMDLFAREGALLSRVTSPEDYVSILSMAPEVGVDTAMWPKPDDPELMAKIKAAVMATMDPKSREELAMKATEAEWKRKRDEQKLGLDERRTAAYERGASQTNINMPGQLAARPLTPGEAQSFGLNPEQASFMMIDGKGNMIQRPLAPGEAERAKADVKEEAAAPKREMQLEQTRSKVKVVTDAIDTALNQVGALTSGVGGAVMRGIPGTDAADLESTLRTVKANIGFAELQAMRAASPTGGALGQVAVQELESLQATLGSLDQKQSPSQLRKNLEKVRQHVMNWERIMARAARPSSKTAAGAEVTPQFERSNDPLKLFGP